MSNNFEYFEDWTWYLTFRDWTKILHSGRIVILRKLGLSCKILENGGVIYNFGLLRELIWEFWLLWGLVKYFEDQLENFKNIEDHFAILRGSGDQNVILQKLGVLTGISRRFQFLRFQSEIFDRNRIFVLGGVSASAYHIFWVPPQYHYHILILSNIVSVPYSSQHD